MSRLTALIALLLAATAVQATTIHVPSEQPTIQAGINAASTNDTVLVADGTYTGSGNRNISLSTKIVVKSVNGPGLSVIDCQSSGRAFYIHDGTGVGPTIQGFTIKNGSASSGGGAIQGWGFSIVVKECLFLNNFCDYGGAFYFNPSVHPGGSRGETSYPTVTKCTFFGNTVSHAGAL